MGINKIKKDFTREEWYINNLKYEKEQNERDICLKKALIDEINQAGYCIAGINQISFMDESDFDTVNPIIIKYLWEFNNTNTRNFVIGLLGKKGNYKITQYILNEFKKPNDYWDRNNFSMWNTTRRAALSNVLNDIADKRYIDEYIELFENPETHDDCHFLIFLLGKIRTEKSYEYLKIMLDDSKALFRIEALREISKFRKHKEEALYLAKMKTTDRNRWVQEEAKKLYKKLNK